MVNSNTPGTCVFMGISNKSKTKAEEVFDEYSVPDSDPIFRKTVIPIALARFVDEGRLISRSQAKRIVNRAENFSAIVFNFEDVKTIGQAFADELFRVFANSHPSIEITYINANESVRKMIARASSYKD